VGKTGANNDTDEGLLGKKTYICISQKNRGGGVDIASIGCSSDKSMSDIGKKAGCKKKERASTVLVGKGVIHSSRGADPSLQPPLKKVRTILGEAVGKSGGNARKKEKKLVLICTGEKTHH